MKFTVATVLAFAASAFAQTTGYLYVSASAETVAAGSSITWTWPVPGTAAADGLTDAKYANQEVTVGLIGGATQNSQAPIQTLGTVNSNAGTYTWNIPAGFGGLAFYGITFTSVTEAGVFQYSPAFHIEGSTVVSSSSAAYSAPAGTKTVSLSSNAAYTAPAAGYTTVDVVKTTTVPCTNGTISATSVYVPPQATVPVVSVPAGNATLSTSYVPPVYTAPSSPYSPSTTPVATPVTGAGARFAAPVAAVAGIVLAALAL